VASRSPSSPAAYRICSRAASPRTSRPASTSIRSAEPSGVVAVISPVQLPGHGAAVVRADRHRLRQRRRHQAVGEGPVGRQRRRRAVAEAGLPDGVMNVVHGDKEAVDALLDTPTSSASPSSARRPSRSTSTRRAPPTASGSRPSAAPRTTCSSCPTPTSTSPPTPPSTLASARPVSAAWRSRRCRGRPIADELIAKITERMASSSPATARRSLRHGPARHQGAPRQGRSYIDLGVDGRRRVWSSTAAMTSSTPMATASSSARRSSTRSPRACRSTRRDLRPGAVGRARRVL
jgi:hypothetical protein